MEKNSFGFGWLDFLKSPLEPCDPDACSGNLESDVCRKKREIHPGSSLRGFIGPDGTPRPIAAPVSRMSTVKFSPRTPLSARDYAPEARSNMDSARSLGESGNQTTRGRSQAYTVFDSYQGDGSYNPGRTRSLSKDSDKGNSRRDRSLSREARGTESPRDTKIGFAMPGALKDFATDFEERCANTRNFECQVSLQKRRINSFEVALSKSHAQNMKHKVGPC